MQTFVENFENSDRLRQRARNIIPGGAHTYARVTTSTLSCLPDSLKGDMAAMSGMSMEMNISNTAWVIGLSALAMPMPTS